MASMLTELERHLHHRTPAPQLEHRLHRRTPARPALTVEDVEASMCTWWTWSNAVHLARAEAKRTGLHQRVQRVDVAPHPRHREWWRFRAWRFTPVEVSEPCS